MKVKVIFFILLALISFDQNSFARSQSLLIYSYAPGEEDHMYKSIEMFIRDRSQLSHDKITLVLPEELTSDRLPPVAQSENIRKFSINTHIDFLEMIQILGKELKPNEYLLLTIMNHGYKSDNSTDILDSRGFVLNSRTAISYSQLAHALSTFIDKRNQIKIVNNACFGSAVHQISFNLPNVCSVSTSDYKNVSWVNQNHESYSDFIFNLVDVKPTSLLGRHVYASFHDKFNDTRQSISSLDFIDFFLELGSYSENYNESPVNTPFLCLFKDLMYCENPFKRYRVDEKFLTVGDYTLPLRGFANTITKRAQEIEVFEEIPYILRNLIQTVKKQTSKPSFERDTEERLQYFVQRTQNTLSGIESIWNEGSMLQKAYNFSQNMTARGYFKHLLGTAMIYEFNLYKFSDSFHKLRIFFDQASEQNKEKFNQLVQCESVPF